MGLSMYERQILSEIERQLRREDPRFAAQMDLLTPTGPMPARSRPSTARSRPPARNGGRRDRAEPDHEVRKRPKRILVTVVCVLVAVICALVGIGLLHVALA